MTYTGSTTERSTIFRLQVYEMVGISLAEVYERVGSVISVGKKAQKGLTDALHGCEKSCQSKGSGFVIYSYFKDSTLTAVKGNAKF